MPTTDPAESRRQTAKTIGTHSQELDAEDARRVFAAKQSETIDRRQAFRYSASHYQHEVELKVGRRRLPVGLLNVSAGGFAVGAGEHPRVAAGDVVQLRTDSDWFEVRVVDVRALEPADPEAKADGWAIRIGLERLPDSEVVFDRRKWLGAGRSWFYLARLSPSSFSMVVVAVLSVLVLIGVPTGVMLAKRHGLNSPLKQSARQAHHLADASFWGSRVPPEFDPKPATPRATAQLGKGPEELERLGREGVATPVWDPAVGEQLRSRIQSLRGAGVFVLPEVAEELSLSDAQQEQVRRIIQETAEALRQIDERWQGDSRWQRSQLRERLFGEARRRALEVLSVEQRARWDRLQGEH